MWDAFPYLGNATSAVLILISICPVTVDLYWTPSSKGDLMHNWAIIASKKLKCYHQEPVENANREWFERIAP